MSNFDNSNAVQVCSVQERVVFNVVRVRRIPLAAGNPWHWALCTYPLVKFTFNGGIHTKYLLNYLTAT